MDAIQEVELRRASLISEKRFSTRKSDEIAPKDKYLLVHVIFFFFGLSSFLSMPFFLTANDYWMYKFRDVSQATYNSSNKTDMQKYFASATSITTSVPGLITTLAAALFGHKVHIKSRILYSLALLTVMYLVFTGFVKVQTDSWQTLFFYVTLGAYVLLTVATSLFNITMTNLIARFPPTYLKTQLYGQAGAGIFSALLQIICLSIANDTITAALIYFLCGSGVLVVTFMCGVLSMKSVFFQFYLGDTVADTKRPVYTMKDNLDAFKRIWPVMVMFTSAMLFIGSGHPNITSLIISENYGSGGAWSDKYFVPVATFLSQEVYGLFGRFLSFGIINRKNAIWFLVLHFIRLIVTTPVFMFCNAQPRHHLPVLFPHDWQYMLIIPFVSLSGSVMLGSIMLSIPNMAGDKTEVAFLTMTTVTSVMITFVSLLSPLYIRLL